MSRAASNSSGGSLGRRTMSAKIGNASGRRRATMAPEKLAWVAETE